MSQHTPGPWVCEPERRLRSQVLSESIGVRGPGGLYIAAAFDFNRYDRDAEVEANAYLIAGAPAMLAELTWAVEWMEAWEGQVMPEWREWAARGRAAIAKATGGAS